MFIPWRHLGRSELSILLLKNLWRYCMNIALVTPRILPERATDRLWMSQCTPLLPVLRTFWQIICLDGKSFFLFHWRKLGFWGWHYVAFVVARTGSGLCEKGRGEKMLLRPLNFKSELFKWSNHKLALCSSGENIWYSAQQGCFTKVLFFFFLLAMFF